MKNNSGVTITSIVVYVIAMVIVIGIIASITSFFYSNVNNVNENSNNISEITKFHMYFLEETTNESNSIISISNNKITFLTGNTFTFQDKAIYFNHVKICEQIESLQFQTEEINQKTIINVLITIGQNNEYTKTTKYVLANH